MCVAPSNVAHGLLDAAPTTTLFVFPAAAAITKPLIRAKVIVAPNASMRTPARSRSSVPDAASVRRSENTLSALPAPVPLARDMDRDSDWGPGWSRGRWR
ncbi:hypothetical protein SCALM49S_02476 [Streptomyces californicus]